MNCVNCLFRISILKPGQRKVQQVCYYIIYAYLRLCGERYCEASAVDQHVLKIVQVLVPHTVAIERPS